MKLTAVGLTLTTVAGLTACTDTKTTSGNAGDVTKPDHFTVMVNNTIVTETNGAQAYYDYLQQLTGLDIKWIRPDHSGYYDAVANAFNANDTMPDVVLLSSDYYSLYAANGFLWNMADAWDKSETKASGRLVDGYQSIIDNLMVTGEDGTKGMYGYSPYRGDGCCTYMKKSWLKDCGIDESKVDGVTMDFNTYYGYLKTMAEKKGHYVISAPGFIGTEAPYTNYLPEFYQDAHYTFYKNASGAYVDGFSEDAMKNALSRIHTAIADGVIDKETVNNSTANARDKFYSTDDSAETGVFTYWCGTWANTLRTNLEAKGKNSDLIAINPVKELGSYIQRIPACWCITTAASNPEGIFKYFIDTMLDGGDVQMAWTYGAKGTHWDDKAETVTVQGKEDKPSVYTEGQFHFLPSVEKPTTLQTKNHIDPLVSLATFNKTSDNPDGTDPGFKNAIASDSVANSKFFYEHSVSEAALPMTTDLSDNNTDINTARNYVISQVALGYMTVDEGMEYYKTTVGSLVDLVVKSLNKSK